MCPSWSWYYVDSTDFAVSLSLSIHCSWQIFQFTSFVHTQLMKAGSYVGVHRTSLMSSSLPLQLSPACLVLTWMVFEMGDNWLYSWGGGLLPGFIQNNTAFLCSSHVAFSLYVLLVSMWCIHTIVLTQLQLGKNPILFYWINQISI